MFVALILLFLVSLLLAINIIVSKKREKELLFKIAQVKADAETKLRSHQALVHPHFLFNVLNNVRYLLRYKPEKAEQSLLQLTDLLRMSSKFAEAEYISLEEEVSFLETYIQLQQIRLAEEQELAVSMQVDAAKQIPPFILINYIENAFKYGVSTRNPQPIVIYLNSTEDALTFQVKNARFNGNEPVISTESGMKMAEERLKIFYPGKYHLRVDETPDTFEINLTIRWK